VGGLQPDEHHPGLFVLGEANFSDHGANRLGASALMQGLADGYFVLPYTIGDYLAGHEAGQPVRRRHAAFRESRGRGRGERSRAARHQRHRTVDSFHRELGKIMWDTAAWPQRPGLERRSARSRRCARSSGATSRCPGGGDELNQSLEKAGRVADFFELAELMCRDALHREESCGGHFREEHQTRRARRCATTRTSRYVAAWEWTKGRAPRRVCTRSRSSSRTSKLPRGATSECTLTR
jgi:succinate dehydrogenase / fumarate reductase, flavoprotein subunit